MESNQNLHSEILCELMELTNLMVDWLILTACPPDNIYFMPRGYIFYVVVY